MKKIISIALVLCLALSVIFALTSCGAISGGTYNVEGLSGLDATQFKVSGSKIIYTLEEDEETKIDFTFTYEVKEDKITVNYEGNSYDGDNSLVKLAISATEVLLKGALNGEKSFEKGDGYFKIGAVKFVKE